MLGSLELMAVEAEDRRTLPSKTFWVRAATTVSPLSCYTPHTCLSITRRWIHVYDVWTHHSVREGPPRACSLNVRLLTAKLAVVPGSLSPIITLSVSFVSAPPSYSSVPSNLFPRQTGQTLAREGGRESSTQRDGTRWRHSTQWRTLGHRGWLPRARAGAQQPAGQDCGPLW
jgi:hypothetical protein